MEAHGSNGTRPGHVDGPWRAISYRSLVAPGGLEEVRASVHRFRLRNRARSITGMLVHDRDRFFQWFEGRAYQVGRLWDAVQRDERHRAIELCGQVDVPARLFPGDPLRIGAGAASDLGVDAVPVPSTLLRALRRSRDASPALWRRLASSGPGSAGPERPVRPDLVADLLARLARPSLDAAWAWVRQLRARGLSAESLFLDVFEPAARRLGDRWMGAGGSRAEVTFGLSALLRLVRRLGPELRWIGPDARHRSRSALVASLPGEPHRLGLGMVSEYFDRAGWDVSCAFPEDDADLLELLRTRHVDVLALCASDAFERLSRLPALGECITAARRASRNRDLSVLVRGRAFFARPERSAMVGADAHLPSADRAVDVADTLVSGASIAHVRRALDEVAWEVAHHGPPSVLVGGARGWVRP
ncbi:MAG TPA: BLUF domain-containing protein [Sandaracinaceae bacterium LLY-WYZ-13_1]|nr:BLUF domain-containing protein [Sandaracinaceae bacterium LLY-WYZ-13_1]